MTFLAFARVGIVAALFCFASFVASAADKPFQRDDLSDSAIRLDQRASGATIIVARSFMAFLARPAEAIRSYQASRGLTSARPSGADGIARGRPRDCCSNDAEKFGSQVLSACVPGRSAPHGARRAGVFPLDPGWPSPGTACLGSASGNAMEAASTSPQRAAWARGRRERGGRGPRGRAAWGRRRPSRAAPRCEQWGCPCRLPAALLVSDEATQVPARGFSF